MNTDEIILERIIHNNKKRIKISLGYSKENIGVLRHLKGVLWSKSINSWHIPDDKHSIEFIAENFPEYKFSDNKTYKKESIHIEKKKTLMLIRETKGRIKLIFYYNKELILLIKTLPYYFYDVQNHWWTLPDTEKIRRVLYEFCEQNE